MTRVVFYHEGNEEIVVLTLSLRGGSGARDAAIHRVSGNAGGLSVRLLRTSGSPRASPSRLYLLWKAPLSFYQSEFKKPTHS